MELGLSVLREIGLKKGLRVLDFGCGRGNYAIPAAKIVGRQGIVYALDKNGRALDELMRRANTQALSNIVKMKTSGEVEISLESNHLDVALLYDIFWYFPLWDERLPRLLDELHRVLDLGAILSVYPKHIDSHKLRDKIESHRFIPRDIYSGRLLHNGGIERGRIFNFEKLK